MQFNPTSLKVYTKYFSLLFIGIFIGMETSAMVIHMERQELIQRSEKIFVGQVINISYKRNQQGNLIHTDVTFQIEEMLLGAFIPQITLTFAGGTLNGETHEVSDVPTFSIQEKALLMVERSDYPLISPITGSFQGKYTAVRNSNGVLVALQDDGSWHHNNNHTTAGQAMEFYGFVEQVRAEIPIALSLPLPNRAVPKQLQKYILTDLPYKIYDPNYVSIPNRPTKAPKAAKKNKPEPLCPEEKIHYQQQFHGEIAPHNLNNPSRWSYSNRAKNVPIVFDPLSEGGLIGSHDQYQMAYWNTYANIYQVYSSPSGTWAWENNVYEIAGFQPNDVMIAQFGEGWGSSTLAVCWKRWDHTNFSIEADIALNPAFNWTVDDYSTYFNSNLYNADRTLLHEIGHSWGLDHQFEALSVMNYAPHKYRAYTILYRDDIAAIKSAFPAQAQTLTDLNVALFYENGYQNYDDSDLSQTILDPGDNFTVSNFVIENTGSTTITTPEVEWYLVPNMNDWTGFIYLGTTTHNTLSSESWFLTSRTLSIPNNVPSGWYYLGAYIGMDSDEYNPNNSSWLHRSIYVSAPTLPLNLLSFNATPHTTDIYLEWTSNNEINFEGFELQRSIDGQYFNTIEWIKSIGDAASSLYQYRDKNVRPYQTYYYRLKMLDSNGKFEYSFIKSAAIETPPSIVLFPNPTKDILNLSIPVHHKEAIHLEVYSINNALLQRKILMPQETAQYYMLDLSTFPRGTYILNLYNKQFNFVEKVVLTADK